MSSYFQSSSLSLRAFEPDDVAALFQYLNHPALVERRYLPWGFSDLAPLSHRQVEAVYEKWAEAKDEFNLAVIHRENQQLIGHASAEWGWDPHSPGISLVISPEHQRRGYGSQVLKLLLRYLFEQTPAHSIAGWVADWNTPGIAFLQKHAFQNAGCMRRAGIRQGQPYDMCVLDLLRPEWLRWQEVRHGA